MSGFVAVANLDGEPIDPFLIRRMTDALRFRGPDAQEVWIGEQVGLGHALFQTTDAATLELQPCSLDGDVWITGDIRLDDRTELVRALREAGQNPLKSATDPQLLLHAYQAWGEALVNRLLGDFSFAIWDCLDKRLFCARDQLGVKPFFYAQLGRQILVSNTLSCLRAHGSMPDELNDAAIGDFLLFGFNRNRETTTYAAVQRLPGGHALSCAQGEEPRLRRYWTLPVYDELRLQRPEDYVERCRSLLEAATADRLRTDRVGVHMSGGLDSPLIAAIAHGLLTKSGRPFEVRAHTIVYDRLFKDEERHFSKVAADRLNIPIQYCVADDYGLLDENNGSGFSFPEPLEAHSQPLLLNTFNQQVAAGSRVALTGLDGDALLTASWPAHLASLAHNFEFGRLAADTLRFAKAKQDLLRAFSHRLRWPRRRNMPLGYPTWLEPAFEKRLELKDRWTTLTASAGIGSGAREGAYRVMGHQNWVPTLEGLDAGVTGIPVDRRHPLLDLRVVGFLLSLPAIPWCVDKHILRASAQDLLPEEIVNRPKTPLQGDPLSSAIRGYLASSIETLALHPALGQYVDVNSLSDVIDQTRSDAYWGALRVLILNHWLSNRKEQSK